MILARKNRQRRNIFQKTAPRFSSAVAYRSSMSSAVYQHRGWGLDTRDSLFTRHEQQQLVPQQPSVPAATTYNTHHGLACLIYLGILSETTASSTSTAFDVRSVSETPSSGHLMPAARSSLYALTSIACACCQSSLVARRSPQTLPIDKPNSTPEVGSRSLKRKLEEKCQL